MSLSNWEGGRALDWRPRRANEGISNIFGQVRSGLQVGGGPLHGAEMKKTSLFTALKEVNFLAFCYCIIDHYSHL